MAFEGISAGKAFVELLLDDTGISEGMSKAEGKLRSWAASALTMGAKIGALGGIIAGPFLVAAHTFASVGEELYYMSKRTGVSVDTLSQLRYAAAIAGTSLGAVERAIRQMQRSLSPTASLTGRAAKAFGELGLSLDELRGMEVEQQFEAIASALVAIQDPTKRVALAIAIMGRQATQIIPLIQQMSLLREEATRFGVTVSEEGAVKAEMLGSAFTRLKLMTTAVSMAIGESLAPALTSVLSLSQLILPQVVALIAGDQSLVETIGFTGAAIASLGSALLAFSAMCRVASIGVSVLTGALTALASHPLIILAALAVAIVALPAFIKLMEAVKQKNKELAAEMEKSRKEMDAARAAAAKAADEAQSNAKKFDVEAEALKRLSAAERELIKARQGRLQERAVTEEKGTLEQESKFEQSQARLKRQMERLKDEPVELMKSFWVRQIAQRAQEAAAAFGGLSKEAQAKHKEELIKDLDEQIAAVREAIALAEKQGVPEIEVQKLLAAWKQLENIRDRISGKAAKQEQDAKREADEIIKERNRQEDLKEKAREREAKHQEELAKFQKHLREQVVETARPIVGGFGGRFAGQIAGTESSVERKMLDLNEKQTEYLAEIRTNTRKGGGVPAANNK